MKKTHSELLEFLQCPYCESPIKLRKILEYNRDGEGMKTGIVSCDYDVYPFIDGILYLKKTQDQKNHRSIALLNRSKVKQAKLSLLEERRLFRAIFNGIEHLSFKQKWLQKKGFNTLMWVFKTLQPESKDWFTYLTHREKRAIFTTALLSLAFAKKQGVYVDLGCGTGQFLRFAYNNFKNNMWIGIDHSYSLLYLARKFIVPEEALLICTDLNIGVPLKKNSIDTAYINDTFMSIHKKKQLLHQVRKILKKDGNAWFNHIHNRGFDNLGQTYAVSSEEVKEMLHPKSAVFITDKKLFKIARTKKFMDIKSSSQKELKKAQSYSFYFKKGKLTRRIKIPKAVRQYLQQINIDFTEDEYLKEDENSYTVSK